MLTASFCLSSFFFFFNDTATTEIYTLSLHDALPILAGIPRGWWSSEGGASSTASWTPCGRRPRSEEHTSELQSRLHLVCRLLLEKKKKTKHTSERRKSDSNSDACMVKQRGERRKTRA